MNFGRKRFAHNRSASASMDRGHGGKRPRERSRDASRDRAGDRDSERGFRGGYNSGGKNQNQHQHHHQQFERQGHHGDGGGRWRHAGRQPDDFGGASASARRPTAPDAMVLDPVARAAMLEPFTVGTFDWEVRFHPHPKPPWTKVKVGTARFFFFGTFPPLV